MPTLRRLFDVRPGERRETTLAFVVLFGMLAAHTILETARDALFLSRLPPSQLPWVYLAMAGTALAVWRAFPSRWSTGPNALPVLILLCAVGTAIFWACRSLTSPWALRALYVWTGLVSTLAAVQFWVLVGEMFTITQAKRVYSIIGLGSLLGAVAGGTLARLLSARTAAADLLLASAAIMALTCVPAVLLRGPRAAAPSTMESFAGQAYRSTAVTETEVTALEVEAYVLMDIFEDNFEVSMDFMAWMAQRTLDLIEHSDRSDPALLSFLTDVGTDGTDTTAPTANAGGRGAGLGRNASFDRLDTVSVTHTLAREAPPDW